MNIASEVVELHVQMLNDSRRTCSYLDRLRRVVKPGDVVLDIGTGTGIYAIAAAMAGARHVYAVELDRIAAAASELIYRNGVSDRVTLIRAASGRIRLPERADVLVSELIGNEPLAERVIGITADAGNRLLRRGARLLPSGIKIFALLMHIPEYQLSKLTFTPSAVDAWRSYYGIDFAPLVSIARKNKASSLFGYNINPNSMTDWKVLSAPVLLADLNLGRPHRRRLESRVRGVASAAGVLNAVVMYFELKDGVETFLSTDPKLVDERNHWLSPVRLLEEAITLKAGTEFSIRYLYRRACGISECEVRAH